MENRNDAYARLCSALGGEMALFCLCAVSDVSYRPESGAERWDEYIEMLGDEPGPFSEGETDVNAAVLAGMERQERWETVWGSEYNENECKRLDDLYRTMTAQLDAAGGLIDKQQEDTARYCSRLALEREKLIRKPDKDNVAMAKNLDDMIRKNLQDCNMRKADILPTQQQTLPGFLDALLQKLGLGMDMTEEEVCDAFARWGKRKKYPFTVDAAEHIAMLILNLIQKNDDMQELSGRPEGMNFGTYEAEFEKEPNEAENDAYRYLGLVRGEFCQGEE